MLWGVFFLFFQTSKKKKQKHLEKEKFFHLFVMTDFLSLSLSRSIYLSIYLSLTPTRSRVGVCMTRSFGLFLKPHSQLKNSDHSPTDPVGEAPLQHETTPPTSHSTLPKHQNHRMKPWMGRERHLFVSCERRSCF